MLRACKDGYMVDKLKDWRTALVLYKNQADMVTD